MKAFVHVSLIAACLIACAHGFPGARRDSIEDDDSMEDFEFGMPNFFSDTINRIRQNLMSYFWNMPDITNISIPDGANTTSTTKVINGHVVTINETTYTSGDENGGTSFRIRIIDVKPQNDTDSTPKAQPEPTENSAETVEEFNNEIPKNGDTLTA